MSRSIGQQTIIHCQPGGGSDKDAEFSETENSDNNLKSPSLWEGPTVCLLMICKGFRGISSHPGVVATWGFLH